MGTGREEPAAMPPYSAIVAKPVTWDGIRDSERDPKGVYSGNLARP